MNRIDRRERKRLAQRRKDAERLGKRRQYAGLTSLIEYEFHDPSGQWYRSYGNELWEFDEFGYMKRRFASINDMPIQEAERKFLWER